MVEVRCQDPLKERSQDYVHALTTVAEVQGVADAWEECRRGLGDTQLELKPSWILNDTLTAAEPDRGLLVYLLESDGHPRAVAPFLQRRWAWPCRLGYRTVARFPVRSAVLYGTAPLSAPGTGDLGRLMDHIAERPERSQAFMFDAVPVDSELWRLLQSCRGLRKRFWIHRPWPQSPRHQVILEGSFEDYLGRFSRKTRYKLRSAVSRLAAMAPEGLRAERVTYREQVPEFLRRVHSLSAASWQGSRLGQVLQPSPEVERRLTRCAEEGWLRGYLLWVGSRPVAFVLGFQSEGTYHYYQIGYDPEYAEHSPGKVLLYLLLEDLFTYQAPERVDFGFGDSEYKQLFGNHSYQEARVLLIRKSPYTGLALATDRACSALTAAVRLGLRKARLRERARRRLRGGTAR
ncbi:MAG TPA: GNAT family N-acetyltransferase [Armatimonadota bacterium]|jgi:hypothetical protein